MAVPKKETLEERVQELSQQLSQVAPALNSESDKLGASISKLEDRIKPLGLGVSSWAVIDAWHSEDGTHYSYDEIGYTRTNGKWGFAIRSRSGNEMEGDDDNTEWPFNEAPRGMRIRAVKKIPELLEKLVKDASSMTEDVSKCAGQVELFANAFTATIPSAPKEKKS